jgi:putative methanogenesis marker protein 3
MKIIVNNSERKLKDGATLKDALAGEPYVKGAAVSILLSTEKTKKASNSFNIVTERGTMSIKLDDSKDAEIWRDSSDSVEGSTLRWITHKLVAFGSFSTKIKGDRKERMYRRYDCFFSLGGFDNNTTYMMIAKEDHKASYGAGTGRIGRVTKGRHIIDSMREGDTITNISPVISEQSTENIVTTSDMSFKLEEGMEICSHIRIELNKNSPMSSEHVLVASRNGSMNVSDGTGSFAVFTDNLDVDMETEESAVRTRGAVTVRCKGEGTGKIYAYRVKRQTIPQHNLAGTVVQGMHLMDTVSSKDIITVETVPKRILSIGMTQTAGEKFLKDAGIKQIRTGDTSDDSMIVMQEPEWTMNVLENGEAETFGIPKEGVYKISLDRKKAPKDCMYFEKVTGLDHKPIGELTVHFTFKGMPLITFDGDTQRGKSLYPGDEFKSCKKGDIGLTNQARPQRGLVGIRLENSKEFGPTGEEPYGTNICGKFEGDLKKMMEGLKEGSRIYITERQL